MCMAGEQESTVEEYKVLVLVLSLSLLVSTRTLCIHSTPQVTRALGRPREQPTASLGFSSLPDFIPNVGLRGGAIPVVLYPLFISRKGGVLGSDWSQEAFARARSARGEKGLTEIRDWPSWTLFCGQSCRDSVTPSSPVLH